MKLKPWKGLGTLKTPTNLSKHLSASGRTRVFSIVLLGMSLIPIAPVNAQACNQGETTAIAGTAVDLEDLIVTIAWQSSVAANGFELAVFDENNLQIAGQIVWPTPGGRTQTTFYNFLRNLPESGFQFFAVVRDSAGQDVSQRHAFRGVLECPRPMEPCEWRTQDGLYTNALAISEPLMTALGELEGERSSNLLVDVLEKHPELRGAVFSLAAQLDQLDQKLDLGNDCFCAWHHSSGDLTNPTCDGGAVGNGQEPDGSGWEFEQFEGKGAAAGVVGQIRNSPELRRTAAGTSWQMMKLSCWKTHQWIEQTDLPLLPSLDMEPRAIRFPLIESCPDSCRGTVESSATIDYQLSTDANEPEGSNIVAQAGIYGYLIRNDGGNQLPIDGAWKAVCNWPEEDGCSSLEEDQIQIPAEGVYVDNNTSQVTAILSGNARVFLQAKEELARSYAKSCFRGTLRVQGHAVCAAQPTSIAELSASNGWAGWAAPLFDNCGELTIEPWDD